MPPEQNFVLASGSDFLLRIPTAQCRRFTSCEACVNARDPYCGYCGTVESCMSTINICPSEFITNYENKYSTEELCYNHQERNRNSTRRVKKIKKKRRRKRRK
eukprot:sb/3478228/